MLEPRWLNVCISVSEVITISPLCQGASAASVTPCFGSSRMNIQMSCLFQSISGRDTQVQQHLTHCSQLEARLRQLCPGPVPSSLDCTAGSDLPRHLNLIVTGSDNLIKEAGHRTTMIRDDRQSFADFRLARAGGKIHMTVLFGKRMDLCIRILADITVTLQAMQV